MLSVWILPLPSMAIMIFGPFLDIETTADDFSGRSSTLMSLMTMRMGGNHKMH